MATRAAIVAAAAERFAEVGYHGATLSEILARSGVTKGAMYFHFPHKEAVAEAVIAATDAAWIDLLVEVRERGRDPLLTLVALTERIMDAMRLDPVVRGGVRLLNDAAVTVEHGAAHYRFAEEAVAIRLRAAAEAGVLLPTVDVALLARQVATLMAGHHLICERSGTLDELPAQVAAMWAALLPLIATDDWLARHRSRA
ncbi:ScbR family autoregulator-binding transcription factor [Actinomycetospora aeridis]|uniref:ScbR family autoregulator-binding transcription factor n=1 Tax=Actinomycetospora aeridis TaxID=3129231 RepID=A0ABU8NGI3_9PSEU